MNLFPLGQSPALPQAVKHLREAGVTVCTAPKDADCILLPVPSLQADGIIKGGIPLAQLPEGVPVIGGNLTLNDRPVYDLLKDPDYVTQNAAITAHCAIKVALRHMERTFDRCPVLVIGWGRIGKCLARLLRGLDAEVTVAARKAADQALLRALGYRTVATESLVPEPFTVIFNTVPVMLLPQGAAGLCIELASKPGIGGETVISALGLPGKEAPETSGKLIAETVLRIIKEEEL